MGARRRVVVLLGRTGVANRVQDEGAESVLRSRGLDRDRVRLAEWVLADAVRRVVGHVHLLCVFGIGVREWRARRVLQELSAA